MLETVSTGLFNKVERTLKKMLKLFARALERFSIDCQK